MITPDLLIAIMPNARRVARVYAVPMSEAMDRYGIDTKRRQAAFLGQIAHESGQLQYTRELWGPTAAQTRYEGRQDLGNTQPGDGRRYLGRGLIQITGRDNYRACSIGLFGDTRLEREPAELETPENACLSAAWFWHSRALNSLADVDDYRAITKKINGGYNGWQDRSTYWERGKRALGIVDPVV